MLYPILEEKTDSNFQTEKSASSPPIQKKQKLHLCPHHLQTLSKACSSYNQRTTLWGQILVENTGLWSRLPLTELLWQLWGDPFGVSQLETVS